MLVEYLTKHEHRFKLPRCTYIFNRKDPLSYPAEEQKTNGLVTRWVIPGLPDLLDKNCSSGFKKDEGSNEVSTDFDRNYWVLFSTISNSLGLVGVWKNEAVDYIKNASVLSRKGSMLIGLWVIFQDENTRFFVTERLHKSPNGSSSIGVNLTD